MAAARVSAAVACGAKMRLTGWEKRVAPVKSKRKRARCLMEIRIGCKEL
jgi:hypothetical protein